jgi:hypothetical protein
MVDSVALTALLVSLVALFTTVGQLLQQYFATADGFRRCQPSVMGLWARQTKLRFRWREFRFETVFVIPRITYGPLHGAAGTKAEAVTGQCSLVDTFDSLEASMTFGGWGSYDARKYYDSDELACWVPLLAQLHKQGQDIVKYFPQSPSAVANNATVPVIQFIQKSWDFMPVDVVRPMASSTVSDVAIMARRLGQVWKSFDPGMGSMRAEGNGHVITSTLARSLGTILQYAYTSKDSSRNCFYIPVKEADKLGFGLVEFDHRLFGPNMRGDLDLGSLAGISRTLNLIISFRHHKSIDVVLRNISSAMNSGKAFIPGLNDMVPLCSAMLSQSDNKYSGPDRWWNRIPSPNLYLKGVTSSREGFRVFRLRLENLVSSRGINSTRQSVYILSCVKTLFATHGARWETEKDWEQWNRGFEANASPIGYDENTAKDQVMKHHSEMTDFLQKTRVRYKDLVSEHIILATRPLLNVPESYPTNSEYGKEDFDPEMVGSMEAYFDCLPELTDRVRMRHEAALTADEVEDAWLSMIFRAFCWQRSHVMIPEVPPLPSEYWNSKMPVYIG